MNEFNKELGEKIYYYRKAINMSTTKLSELSGTSQSTISKIENGYSSTNIQLLLKICEVLGVSLYDVLPKSSSPDLVNNNSNREQLLNILNRMSEQEINLVLAFLKIDFLPTLKSINELVKNFEKLEDKERAYLITFFNSISND